MSKLVPTDDWQSAGPIAQDEGWMARGGDVLLSTDEGGDALRGVRINDGASWPFPEGATVYYRRVSGQPEIHRAPIA